MIYFGIFILEIILLFFLSQQVSIKLSHLLYKVFRNEHAAIYVLSFLFLPGTIIHELSHMLTAAILMVHVGNIEFVPKVNDHGVKLGSVSIASTDPIRRALIGFAPFFLGLALLIGSVYYLTTSSPLSLYATIALGVFIAFEIGNTMFSSKKDAEGAIETFMATAVISIILHAIGVRIPQSAFEFLFSNDFATLFKTISLYLLVPVCIDFFVVAGLGKLTGR